MNAAEDFEISKSVGCEMPRIHQALDVAFSFAASFTQVSFRTAEVDVINDELPALVLTNTDRIVGEHWGGEESFVVARNRIAQVVRSAD
ncbi:hypothetical protein [Pseudomonas sp. SMN11]|uniref:hypothetical protein n=1 Tax=Pseudomonas sp. SMN11 TaxID=3390197 RepID=UPI003EEB7B02